MNSSMTARTRRRLHIQGFDTVPDAELAPVAPWLRLSFILCALLGAVGTAMASPGVLVALAAIAALAAASPVHPFDPIYNYGIRHITGTGPLPARGLPSRFGCGMGALMLLPTAWAFAAGHSTIGYVLGAALTSVAFLVGTTDICLPSMLYRTIFGWPTHATAQHSGGRI